MVGQSPPPLPSPEGPGVLGCTQGPVVLALEAEAECLELDFLSPEGAGGPDLTPAPMVLGLSVLLLEDPAS